MNGKAQTVDADWEEMKKQISDVTRLLGSLLFTPAFIVIGLCYGIRAGLIVAVEKTLAMLKGWGE